MDKDSLNYLSQELDKVRARKEHEENEWVKQKLDEKRYTGTAKMQAEARRKVEEELRKESQKRLEEHTKAVEKRLYENHGGSREIAWKRYEFYEKTVAEFNQKAQEKSRDQDHGFDRGH